MTNRTFKMHEKLIFDVIRKQAGTLSKAILEGIMNAVDAGAKGVHVVMDERSVKLSDDGRGIRDMKEIEDFFETFGQPHDDSERKVFGKFRMGRGQMFSFGRNVWRTGKFRMDVDVKENGLDYKLEGIKEGQAGCDISIALYDELIPSEIARTIKELNVWCKWAPIKVTLNGNTINMNPKKSKWSHELDEAYVSLKPSGGLRVYNQGIFVMEIANYRYGTGGEVVTKVGHDLDVNFARNDILSSCKVWKKVSPFLDKWATESNSKRKSLDEGARQRLAEKLRSGEHVDNAEKLRLFTAVTGRQYSAQQILQNGMDYGEAPRGDIRGDKLMRSQIAFIFATETLDRFGFNNSKALMRWMKDMFGGTLISIGRYREYDDLTGGLGTDAVIIEEKRLTPKEKVWFGLFEYANFHVYGSEPVGGWDGRKIVIGSSSTFNGWTDGKSYVAISKEFLKATPINVMGFTKVGTLLIHEACHDDLDTVDHDHSQEFYEKFHDAVAEQLPGFVIRCLSNLKKVLDKMGRAMTKKQLAQADHVAKSNAKMRELGMYSN